MNILTAFFWISLCVCPAICFAVVCINSPSVGLNRRLPTLSPQTLPLALFANARQQRLMANAARLAGPKQTAAISPKTVCIPGVSKCNLGPFALANNGAVCHEMTREQTARVKASRAMNLSSLLVVSGGCELKGKL